MNCTCSGKNPDCYKCGGTGEVKQSTIKQKTKSRLPLKKQSKEPEHPSRPGICPLCEKKVPNVKFHIELLSCPMTPKRRKNGKHRKARNIACAHCKKAFSSIHGLITHTAHKHLEQMDEVLLKLKERFRVEGVKHCRVCNALVPEKSLEKHLRKHAKKTSDESGRNGD